MRTSFAFAGAVLIGLGLGMAFDQIAVGSIVGVGVGFVLWALFDRRSEALTRGYWREQRALRK